MNYAEIIITVVLIGLIALALGFLRKRSKSGGCCGGCSGCSVSSCSVRQPEEEEKPNDENK